MKQKLAIIASILFLTFGIISDARSQWVQVAHPFYIEPHPPGGGTQAFAVIDTIIFAGGFSGLVDSHDAGNQWNITTLTAPDVDAMVSDGMDLFVGSQRYNQGFFHSSDKGKTWSKVDSGVISSVDGLAKLDTILFASGTGNWDNKYGSFMFRSQDHGKNWTVVNGKLSGSSFARIGTTFFGGAGYAEPIYGAVSSSNDGGITWTVTDTTLKAIINCLISIDTLLFAGTENGVLRSIDRGISWDTIYKISYVLCFESSGKDFFAGTLQDGVLHSADEGKTWQKDNIGMGNNRINSLVASGSYIFAGDEGGAIWRRSLSDFSLVNENFKQQENISLSPNPTNGIITVHNTPANILHVTVNSIFGESVLELAHPNTPEFTLDLSKLPPGIYFARFVMAGEVVTRKIIKE